MIRFFSEEISFNLPDKRKVRSWIQFIVHREGLESGDINYIFCSDTYLHAINVTYLNHDTLTDIITFDQSDGEFLEGDIYISIDRVHENALQAKSEFTDELHRVMIHGILHLAGHNDKTSKEKSRMREKEDECLSLRNK